ncbi:MAG: hypothetical protein AAFR27_01610, partial [Pseudomonadota bacterium]
KSRAIAVDMESATIAANGFRCRVPYGTLLCVSDKPLHGELKLPGMASEFYKRQVAQHLDIGIRYILADRGFEARCVDTDFEIDRPNKALIFIKKSDACRTFGVADDIK